MCSLFGHALRDILSETSAVEIDELTALKGCWARMRYGVYFVVVLLTIGGIIDYQIYYAKLDRAMSVVSELDGRAGSLLDWPFGREIAIVFERPLSDKELERLSVVKSLQGRHVVAVVFRCEMTHQQLESALNALPDMAVRQAGD